MPELATAFSGGPLTPGSLRGLPAPRPAGPAVLPVPASLAGLFPYGGPVRGSILSLDSPAVALALLAPASAAGSWCAAIGFGSLGLAAVASSGLDLRRFVLVPDPGERWPIAVATALDGFDALLVRAPRRMGAADGRRLAARARERRCTVLVLGEWAGPSDMRLRVEHSAWEGLERGHGRLTGRHATVLAEGRGAAARQRRASAWLS